MYDIMGVPPEFKTDDTIYTYVLKEGNPSIRKGRIRYAVSEIWHLEGKTKVLFTGYYDLNIYVNINSHMPPSWCHQSQIFTTKEKAEQEIQFTTVEFSDQEWYEAIGDRDDKECDLSKTNLGVCCAEISEMRDILLEVKEYEKCFAFQKKKLQELIRNHDFKGKSDSSPLSMILQTIGVN